MSEAATAAGFNRLLSDERLTRRAVGGDERAFAAIFRRYHQSLYRFCLAIVGNPEDAQDALQNTMMKVLRALPGEERKIELKPWLYRIAHNESIDLLRRRRETRELKVEQVAPGYGLAEDAETRERLRRLLTDLRELPERQREVLVMRELAGLDFDEIGTALATTSAVARQTLYEARQSLLQMEEGREMSCETVMRALSDGDGRVTRRRDVRAHLRSCAGCRRFRDEIKSRESTFAAISPLPAMAAAGMLQGLAGGSQAASGGGLAAALGGGAAKTVGASAAAKGVATVAVVAAVGVGAADRTGVINLGLPGESGSAAKSSEAVPGTGGGAEGQRESSQSGTVGGDAAKGGGNHEGQPGGSAGVGETDPSQEPAPAAGTEGAPVAATTPGIGGHPSSPKADSKAQGPPLEHVTAPGHEEHPGGAAHGEEPAAEKKEDAGEKAAADDKAAAGEEKAPPASEDGGGDDEGGAPVNVPKSAPASPPSSPPSKAPGNPPAQSQPPASDKGAPGPPAGSPGPPSGSPEPPAGSPGPPSGSPGPPAGSPGPPSGSPGPPAGSPGPPGGSPGSSGGKGKGKGAVEGGP